MSTPDHNLSVSLTEKMIQDVIREAINEHNGPLSSRIADVSDSIRQSIMTDLNQEEVRKAMVKAGRGVLKSITRRAVDGLEVALLDLTGDNSFEVGLMFASPGLDPFPVRNEHFRFDTLESAQSWGEVQIGRTANSVFTGMSHHFAVAADAEVVDFFVTIISKADRTDKARLEPSALDAMKNSVVLLREFLDPKDVKDAIISWIESTIGRGRTDRNLRVRVVMSRAGHSITDAILDTPVHLLFPDQPINPEGITPAAAVEAMAELLDSPVWTGAWTWNDKDGRSCTMDFGQFPNASLAFRKVNHSLEVLDEAPPGFTGIRLQFFGKKVPGGNDSILLREAPVILTLHSDGPFG